MRIKDVISLLEKEPMTAREICNALQIDPPQEKVVFEVIKRSAKILKRRGKQLLMIAPKCRKCGFQFETMNPSRCPKCKSEWIEPARFFVRP